MDILASARVPEKQPTEQKSASSIILEDYKDRPAASANILQPGKEFLKGALKQILTPSLTTLLLSCSAILITYAMNLNAMAEYIVGVLFLLPAGISVQVLNRLEAGKGVDDSRDTERDREKIDMSQRISRARTASILFPILIALFMVMRVRFIMDDSFPASRCMRAEVASVTQLRYNQQVILIHRVSRENGPERTVRSVAYCPAHLEIHPYDRIEITAAPQHLDPQSGTSFHRYLIRRGYRHLFHLRSTAVTILKRAAPDPRREMRQAIEKSLTDLFNPKTASILKALYFGNKNHIKKSIVHDFTEAGVLHILAASGLHVGIIASIPFMLLGMARVRRNLILLISTAVLLLYLYITDVPVSLFRACVMFTLYTFQRLFDFDRNIFNTLFLSAIIILLIHPYELYSPGFQLSFGATFGILLLFRRYRQTLSFLPAPVASSIALTLAAQLFATPIIWFHMREIHVTGILSNLFAVPGIALTLISSLTAIALGPLVPELSQGIAYLTEQLIDLIHALITIVSGWSPPPASALSPECLLPYALMLLLIPVIRRRRLLTISIIISYLLSIFIFGGNGRSTSRIILLRNSESQVLAVQEDDTVYLTGTLGNFSDAKKMNAVLSDGTINRIHLYLTAMDYRTITLFTYLIKKTPVSTCSIPADFILAGYLKTFFNTLDIDEIPLAIQEIPTVSVTPHRYDEQFCNALAALERKPLISLRTLYRIIDELPADRIHLLGRRAPGRSILILNE
jgi:ComEC/Rec2-related protein